MERQRTKQKSASSSIDAAAASLFQFSALDSAGIDTDVIIYPYEQTRCPGKNAEDDEESYFSRQTAEERQQQRPQVPKHVLLLSVSSSPALAHSLARSRFDSGGRKKRKNSSISLLSSTFQSKLNSRMADGRHDPHPDTAWKSKEHVRVFSRRRHRRRTVKHRKRQPRRSSSCEHSYDTLPSRSDKIEGLVAIIRQELHRNQKKCQRDKNIIVVNYKPVFMHSGSHSVASATATTKLPSKSKLIATDDDFSSATHYSRRRSLTTTTTSSDGSPLRSTRTRSPNQPSLSLDLPDVEDPLVFIEMMYQQLFTEDGHLRNGTEPTVLANCVKQIVTNSRRNSISSSSASSSSIANGSMALHVKQTNTNSNHQVTPSNSPPTLSSPAPPPYPTPLPSPSHRHKKARP